MDDVSIEIVNKANQLLKEGRVKIEFETDKRIHFRVIGNTEEHSVIYDKEIDGYSCDCKFFTLKQKDCSHIVSAKLLMKK